MDARDGILLVLAVIRKVADGRQLVVTHCPCMLLQKCLWGGFPISLQVTESFGASVFGVGLQSPTELSFKVRRLNKNPCTIGFDVV